MVQYEKQDFVQSLISKETERQLNWIELIASENYPSKTVQEVVWSIFMAKYAEGYPNQNISDSGKSGRYYGWCNIVNELENECKTQALKMFWLTTGWEYHVNVQGHSGSTVNQAVQLVALNPNDKILSFDLSHGWHLSHWMKINLSGRLYEIHHYWVEPETYVLDYDKIEAKAIEVQPKLIIAGGSAYSREIDFKRFREIADKVWALLMIDMAHIAWLVSAWIHNSPFEAKADFVTTTTHKTLRGNRGWLLFCKKEFANKIDTAIFPGLQGWPLMNEIAGKTQTFIEANTEEFKQYQRRVVENSKLLSEKLKEKIKESGLNWEILTEWTDNHLLLLSFQKDENMTWALAEEKLWRFHITVNKNLIPFDTRSPQITSWIRIGTPAITTRWMSIEWVEDLSNLIIKALIFNEETDNENEIKELVEKFIETHLDDQWIDWRNLFWQNILDKSKDFIQDKIEDLKEIDYKWLAENWLNKAKEIYNSEQVQNLKNKAEELTWNAVNNLKSFFNSKDKTENKEDKKD